MSAAIEKDSDEQLDALRTEKEHHQHHARGDIGGKYHDQVADSDGDEHLMARQGRDVRSDAGPVLVVVMGVSASGKSTVGAALAHALGIPFTDADELHPEANIDKMARGVPLTDADRQPWLERVRAEAVRTCKEQAQDPTHTGPRGIVVGCSALKRAYRDILRGFLQSAREPESSTDAAGASPAALPTYFVHIRGSREALLQRMENRKGHFMKTGMLDSQLTTLEPPEETGEPNVATVELEASVDEQIQQAREALSALGLKV